MGADGSCRGPAAHVGPDALPSRPLTPATEVPPLSVVLPVSDGRFLEPCLDSIDAQTFVDFELVMAMNGLGPDATALLRERGGRDGRIVLHEQAARAGLVASANQAVARARAPLVARMDADDVAHPDRLRRQMEVFRARPDAVLVGVLADGIDAAGRRVRPRDAARLRRRGIFLPFPHGSAMFRREVFDRVGGYRAGSEGWEDLDLFLRMSGHGRVFVIPEALYSYRYHTGSATTGTSPAERARAIAVRQRCIAAYRAGMSHDGLPAAAVGEEPGPAAVAEARAERAAYRVWAGDRAPLDVGIRELLRGGSIELAGRALLYGTWGHVGPSSLRAVLSRWISVRDRLAGRRLGEDACEWHFGSR